MRASDADRQRMIDLLRGHCADGRLTLEEFEERVDEALHAVTVDDLQHVLRELPQPVAPAPRPPAPPRTWTPLPTPVLVAMVVVGVSLLTGWFAWWLLPVGFWLLGGRGVCRPHRHHAQRL